MKNGMQEFSMNTMENLSGGAIIQERGRYRAVSDPSHNAAFYTDPCFKLEAAQKKAEKHGWSTKVYTRREYEEAAGHLVWF